MHTVYLAGPITGLDFSGATNWRDEVSADLAASGHVGLSPMRGKDYLEGEGVLLDQYLEHPMSTQAAITGRDRWDATRCDILFVNLLGAERVSIGTVMEIAWADENRIPILIAMEDEGNVHDHAMIRGCLTWRVNNLIDALVVMGAALSC